MVATGRARTRTHTCACVGVPSSLLAKGMEDTIAAANLLSIDEEPARLGSGGRSGVRIRSTPVASACLRPAPNGGGKKREKATCEKSNRQSAGEGQERGSEPALFEMKGLLVVLVCNRD